MEEVVRTNLQRFERLIAEVNGAKKDIKGQHDTENSGHFFGQIGRDVTYSGEWVGTGTEPGKYPYKFATEKVWLYTHGELIASVVVKNGVTDYAEKRKQLPTTLIEVFSARCGNHGIMDKDVEALKQLRFFHARDESANDVIDQIFDTIAYSKAKASYDKKFSQLNIATKLSDLKVAGRNHDYRRRNDFEQDTYLDNIRKEQWAFHNLITQAKHQPDDNEKK